MYITTLLYETAHVLPKFLSTDLINLRGRRFSEFSQKNCGKVYASPLLNISVCGVCVCVCFLPIHSGHQVRWTYQPGSHRRKVTQDF